MRKDGGKLCYQWLVEVIHGRWIYVHHNFDLKQLDETGEFCSKICANCIRIPHAWKPRVYSACIYMSSPAACSGKPCVVNNLA
jgi:hypothetical protein